jgi:hypothetical protein
VQHISPFGAGLREVADPGLAGPEQPIDFRVVGQRPPPAALAFRAYVRQRTDFVPWRVRRCAMSKNRRMLWSSAVVCAMCGWRLLPLGLAPGSPDDPSAASADRPDLKCPSCGQCYQWQTSCGWVPTGNTECVASPDVYELTGHVVERQQRRRRSTPEQPIVLRDDRLR